MRLSSQLVQVADQHGSGFAAIRLAKGVLLPVEAQSVKDVASGSAVIVDVVIHTKVQNAAVANRTLTTQCVERQGHRTTAALQRPGRGVPR